MPIPPFTSGPGKRCGEGRPSGRSSAHLPRRRGLFHSVKSASRTVNKLWKELRRVKPCSLPRPCMEDLELTRALEYSDSHQSMRKNPDAPESPKVAFYSLSPPAAAFDFALGRGSEL
jgi:hypothetical protein